MTAPSSLAHRNLGDALFTGDPEAEAITWVGPEHTTRITFADFVARADATAARLLDLGLRPGAPVAVQGLNTIEWLVAFYGILRAGLVAVPLSPKLPPDTLAVVLDNSEATLLLTDDRGPRPAHHAGQVRPLAEFTLAPGEGAAQQPLSRHPRRGSDPAMILYTSGSTGAPKGVVLSHDSHLWVLATGFDPKTEGQDRATLVAAPLHHMNALANVQAALLAGHRVVLLPQFDARTFLRAIDRERVARATGVPPMFALALREVPGLPDLDLTSVREIFMGSSPASEQLFADLARVFPRATVTFGYGTTESGPVAFTRHPAGLETPVGSVGVAHPAVDLRLVGGPDPDHGVLEIRTPALLSGYHRRPDLPHPLTGDGYYHTRDEFRRDVDGFYFFTGRSDDMFTSGGENVYPHAVEQVLQQHPDIAEAAVVPVPDEVKGARPVAFVVPAAGRRVVEDRIRQWSLTQLEPFAHPRRVFVLDRLPLSPTNKVDRLALTRLAAEQVRR